MMKSLFIFAVVCLCMTINPDNLMAQKTKAEKLEEKNAAKAIDKAAKEAANIMCKCDAIMDMANTIQLYKDNPNLVVTEEVSTQVKGYIEKSTACIEKFENVTKTMSQDQLVKYNDAVEARMLKKCPDVLKIINAFAQMED